MPPTAKATDGDKILDDNNRIIIEKLQQILEENKCLKKSVQKLENKLENTVASNNKLHQQLKGDGTNH